MKNFTAFLKKVGPDAACVALFLVISFAYFITPLSQGLVLGGHDNTGGIGAGKELTEYQERTGERTRWTNALFSGMPTYQIAPSYESSSFLGGLQRFYQLGTTGVLSYLFLYMLGFYIMLRAFNFKPYLAALGSILWSFSSYFLIIIAAGHIWKVFALSFVPPTIGGMVLCYRGKYLLGGVVTALFTAFEVLSNHVQMTYYFLFVMAFIVLAYLVAALLPHREPTDQWGVQLSLKNWCCATLVVVVAGLVGVATNVPNLYHTYEYQKLSMRGPSELTLPSTSDAADATSSGLERSYITQWSYGIGETMTLLIPDYKGGGNGSMLNREGVQDLKGYDDFYAGAATAQQIIQQSGQQATPPGLDQYWGDQPFTVGPVYVGALVCFFFVLGLFLVRGPMKWALLAATILSLLFAWGKNLMPATDFFIDYLPMYSKFRTVSSALVIAEFTMPLLAVLCMARLLREPEALKKNRVAFGVSLALTAGLCFVLWLVPSLAGDCLSQNDRNVLQALAPAMPPQTYAAYVAGISAMHQSIIAADALRSLVIIIIGVGALLLFTTGRIKGWMLCATLAVVSLFDLWQIDKRYLNDSNFTDPTVIADEAAAKTPADEMILNDTSNYRVVDLSKNIFNDNSTGYWHKNIGGYHAAKLHRYQDLIDRQIQNELPQFVNAISLANGQMEQVKGDSLAPVLNMLNLKYVIFGSGQNAQAVENPYANGNGWFVEQIDFVKNADAEMAALTGLDTKRCAVADESFKDVLNATPLDTGSVVETKYEPNELHYAVESEKGGVVVFSEIYYPGWTATIDGEPAELGRVNYVLRALRVPAGKHEIIMEFRPDSLRITESIAYVAILLTLGGFIFAFVRMSRRRRSELRNKSL